MNLDERLLEIGNNISYRVDGMGYDKEGEAEIKQLIKEVLEYVKPKTGAYGQEITPTEDLVLDADHCAQCYLGHMEAKQKELGL